MPVVAGFAKWWALRAEREDDEREFADLAEVDGRELGSSANPGA